jgi:hypothetical protein
MGKMNPNNIMKLVKQGRLVPVINKMQDGKYYLIGYKRKGTSRKAKTDSFLLPTPEEINVPENFKI